MSVKNCYRNRADSTDNNTRNTTKKITRYKDNRAGKDFTENFFGVFQLRGTCNGWTTSKLTNTRMTERLAHARV